MKLYLALFLIILSANTFSAVPTVEGLFRNINNKDIDGNIVVMTFQISEKQNKNIEKDNGPSDEQNSEEISVLKKPMKKYYRIFLSIENPRRIEYLKIEYNSPSMNSSGVTNVSYYPNILNKMSKDKSVERELFFSMINMYALNDSRGISKFLSRYNGDYYSNKSVLNEKKVALYSKYKKYLEKVNENKELKDELTSPFTNEDPEKNKEIAEVLEDSMYLKSNKVFLHKEGKHFFWKVDLDSTKAFFENNNLKLKKIVFNNGGGNIKVNIGEYILFDGVHELPKVVFFKNLLEKIYKVRILKYKIYSKLTKTIKDRYKEINEELVTIKEAQDKIRAQDGKVAPVIEEIPEVFFY